MKTLKKFDFQAFGAGRSDYDWDAILNGDAQQLTAGEDYSCKTVTFATLARSAARKRSMVIQTGKPEGVEGIVIKASPASEEQIAAWATADAEAKTKKAADKAAKKATPEVTPPAPEPKKGKAGKGK